MIFITGDTHSDFTRFNRKCFPLQKQMSRKDYVIICGDFGGIIDPESTARERYWLDWLEGKNFTTLFLDGNHENFDRLAQFPEEEWNGGRVRRIRPSVLHLMRGQVFCLQGLRFFTFGGARSHDISLGILEKDDIRLKNRRWARAHDREYRINHLEWWEQEMPSSEEMQEGLDNLRKAAWEVDFILTHCAPTSGQIQINPVEFKQDELTDYLEHIQGKCSYRKWFCGHYHMDCDLDEKTHVVYQEMIQLC